MDRKKQLKTEYKQRRPPMGVFTIQSGNLYYLEAAKDLNAAMNSALFKLNSGNHPHKELQKNWKASVPEDWVFEILEPLEYDSDGLQEDYTEELAILKAIWTDRLTGAGKEVWQRS